MKPESCYWDNELRQQIGTRLNKIRYFLRNRLISPVEGNEKIFLLHPEPGRNQIHTVDSYLWTCTCQHYNLEGTDCSHILAVKLFLDQVADGGRNFYEGWERQKEEEKKKEDMRQEGLYFGE